MTPREKAAVLPRAYVAQVLDVSPGAVLRWEAQGLVPKGPNYTEHQARRAAAYAELLERLKPSLARDATPALDRPLPDGRDPIGVDGELYAVVGRTSGATVLVTSLDEVGAHLPLTEDVRLVRLDQAMASMSRKFAELVRRRPRITRHSAAKPRLRVVGAEDNQR